MSTCVVSNTTHLEDLLDPIEADALVAEYAGLLVGSIQELQTNAKNLHRTVLRRIATPTQ
jgi:hypothetical protein